MLKLYYTTVTEYNQSQPSIYKSLGGYKSSSMVKNDSYSNLFDELSLMSSSSMGKDQYIGLVLKNEGNEIASGIQLWFEPINEDMLYCKFELAAEQMSLDKDGNPQMETIETIYNKPFYAQFYSATMEDKVTIGDLNPNEEVGIWIKRIVLKDRVKEDYNDLYEKDPSSENRYCKKVKKQEESMNLQIEWL